MPGLRPTLIIGLGTTGLHVIDYLRQFLLEEYGTMDLQCMQFLCFETRSDAPSRTDVRVRPLTILNTATVKYQMNHPLDNQAIKVEGYQEWLPNDVLTMGDSFVAGAGSRRAAGRLILWENWENAKGEIGDAIRRCTAPESILKTSEMLKDHYDKNRVAYDPSKPLVSADDLIVYVIGTFCGGSCSGMFIDLGLLVRSIRENAKRVLIATTLTENQAKQEKYYTLAANCFGAMKELDFYYQRLPENAWAYRLPDNTRVKPGDEPYYLAYLVSLFNGQTDLDEESALNQMVAMNLFLDIVGQGYASKVGAVKDLESTMALRNKDAAGYVRQFYSFGLSAVWYPKSKITGIAACDLATDLCDKWMGSRESVKSSEIKMEAERDCVALKALIDEQIMQGLEPLITRLENVEKPTMIRDQTKRPSESLRQTGDVFLAQCLAVDERMKEIVRDAQRALHNQLVDRVFKQEKDCARSSIYWEFYRRNIDDAIGARAGAATPKFSLTTPALNVLQNAGRKANDNSWVWLLGLRRRANQYYREQFIEQAVREWKAVLNEFKESRRRAVLCILRCDQRDEESLSKYYPEETLRSFLQQMTSWLASLEERIKATQRHVESHRREFETLGGSRIVHQVYKFGSMESDIQENKKRIKEGSGSPAAVSILWHLTSEERRPSTAMTEQEFWNLDPQLAAETIVTNYQREGLRHLPPNLAEADESTLVSLMGHAKPYAETNERWKPVATHRSPDFVFGGMDTERLQTVGRALRMDHLDNQCQFTGLRHILFLYRELRCFAVDALKVFEESQRRAAGHPYLTHKDPSFFDWRRIENAFVAEMLMESSLILFAESVYDNAQNHPRFTFIASNMPEDFNPGNRESYTRMARIPGALDAFKEKIKRTLRALTLQKYNELHLAKTTAINDEKHEAVHQDVIDLCQRKLALLKTFRETFAPEVFPELKPAKQAVEA